MEEKVFTKKDLQYKNNSVIKIVIPDGYTKIDDRVFYDYKNLKEIVLPQTIVKIGKNAFYSCDNLKEIILPENIKEIGPYAFCGCDNLKEFIFPENIKETGSYVLASCDNLEKVVLPKTLEKISGGVLKGCKKLKNIVIPEKVKRIGPGSFFDSGLNDITLPENLEFIGSDAFRRCWIQKIVIPDKVSIIGGRAFGECHDLRKVELSKDLKIIEDYAFSDTRVNSLTVHASYGNLGNSFIEKVFDVIRLKSYNINSIELVIKYENYDELYSFIEAIKDESLTMLSNENKNIKIVLLGEKLSLFQKFDMRKELYNIADEVSFEIEEKNIVTATNIIIQPELSNEIKELLNEINTISSNLPTEIKNIINNKVSRLLDNYHKEMTTYQKNKRPTLNLNEEENVDLKLEQTDPEVMLLVSLKKIKLDLNSYEKLLTDLASIYKCKELLGTRIDKQPAELNSLEEIVSSILYLINKIDDKKKEEVINTVTNYLNKAEVKYKKDLNNLFGDNDIWVLGEDFETDKELKINLLNTLDELLQYSKKTLPYLELLDAINCNNVTNYVERESISDTILSIKYLLSFIANEKNREQLKEEFDRFCIRNMYKIENILMNHNDIKPDDYQKFELEMRKEITPILEKLDLYSNKDKNEKDILIQLANSIDILNSDNIVEVNRKKAIESWIAEIHNRIISNDQVFDNEKEDIKQKLLNIINIWIDKINKMNDEENMTEVMKAILKDIAGVHINVDKFLTDLSKINNKNSKQL